jgi:tetratricopeptide (TPR) repeat protein
VTPVDLRSTAPDDLAVLVGAGGSWRAGLPRALDLLDALLEETIADGAEAAALQAACRPGWPGAEGPFDYLRFETVLGWVAELVDPRLELLRIFELARCPSPLQLRLAELGVAGTRLATVNFDDLLEQAIARVGGVARTVDAHANRAASPAGETPVLKLHGTVRAHGGGRMRRSAASLHATVAVITSRSPNLMLSPRAAGRLHEAVDGRVLLVVGYSAADDLDIVPALRELRPSAVVWVDHADGAVRRVPVGGSPGRDEALRELEGAAVRVDLLRGPTEQVLTSVGLGAIGEPPPAKLAWRSELHDWALVHRDLLDRGRPLAAMLWGELEEWGRKASALRRSTALSGRVREQPWTASKRAYELGQTAFFANESVAVVRRWAGRAERLAESDGDAPARSRALSLRARAASLEDDWPLAVELYRKAMDATDRRSLEWATAAERCANALMFSERNREGLALSRAAAVALRRWGDVNSLVDVHHSRGMALRSLGRMRQAADAFASAEQLALRFPMTQQHFAAAAMHGETLRLLGDLDAARVSLRSGIASALRTYAYPSEIAMAHHFLARVEIDAGRPDRAAGHLDDAVRVLRAAPSGSPGLHAVTVLGALHRAELALWAGRRDLALRRLNRVRRGNVPAGEPQDKVALLEHLLGPTATTAAGLTDVLAKLEQQEVSVFIDFSVALAVLGPPDARRLRTMVSRAQRLLRRWGNDALAAKIIAPAQAS